MNMHATWDISSEWHKPSVSRNRVFFVNPTTANPLRSSLLIQWTYDPFLGFLQSSCSISAVDVFPLEERAHMTHSIPWTSHLTVWRFRRQWSRRSSCRSYPKEATRRSVRWLYLGTAGFAYSNIYRIFSNWRPQLWSALTPFRVRSDRSHSGHILKLHKWLSRWGCVGLDHSKKTGVRGPQSWTFGGASIRENTVDVLWSVRWVGIGRAGEVWSDWFWLSSVEQKLMFEAQYDVEVGDRVPSWNQETVVRIAVHENFVEFKLQ